MQWLDKLLGLGGREQEVIDEPAPVTDKETVRWDGVGQLPLTTKEWLKAITTSQSQAEKIKNAKSFSDLIQAQLELDEHTIALSDLSSFGTCFDVIPVVTEARSREYMEELLHKIEGILNDAIPKDQESPWFLQVTLQDEEDMEDFKQSISDYPQDEKGSTKIMEDAFTQEWIRTLHEHVDDISQPEGLFDDSMVTGGIWRGKYRRVRLYLWRVTPKKVKKDFGAELEQVVENVMNRFKAADIKINRLPSSFLYQWLSHFFVPDGEKYLGKEIKHILKESTSPGESGLGVLGLLSDGIGGDIARASLHGTRPYSDEDGTWYFTGKPTKFLSVAEINKEPPIGALSGELQNGDMRFALWDKMPIGSIWSMTIIFEPEEMIMAELEALEKNTIGDSERASYIKEQIAEARDQIARGNPIYKAMMGVYVRADNERELETNIRSASAWIESAGLKPVSPQLDLISQDMFIRALPFNFDLEHDKQPDIRRARKWFSNHLARVIPFYGRGRGTGNLGCFFFNRGAEPLTFDPILDRVKNAFMLILGPSGSGKSSLLNFLICQYMAFHNAQFFVIEKGKSFYLLGKFLALFGKKVHQITITPKQPISLNPFNDACRLEEVVGSEEEFEDPIEKFENTEDEDEDDQRDELGEMMIAAITMITGGEEKELHKLARHERYQIQLSIVSAGKKTKERGYTLPEDIAEELWLMSQDTETYASDVHRLRLLEFSQSMRMFCEGVRGKFFNIPGEQWPDADITIFDIGMMSSDNYSDMLGVSMVSMLNKVISIAEAKQNSSDKRPIIVLADEGHITTTNPLLAPIVTNMTKMARKLGLWFWLATQNLEDFKDSASKMLSNMEWWISMATTAKEVREMSRFRSLSPSEEQLLLAARKEPGKYTEGVVMTDKFISLFRNVQPPISMALAQTEKEEKFERTEIMKEMGFTKEMDAVFEVAKRMKKKRKEIHKKVA